MNVSYRWLRALAPGLERSPEEVAEVLTHRGFPVEGMRELAKGLEGIVLARIEEVRSHPGADRLTLCDVEGGEGVVQVVCGAPNVRPGAWAPFAPVGASLPDGTKIKEARIRGEASQGMLCSERELGLGRDHTGILLLDGDFSPGQAFVEALGLDDVRLEVEVTSNRPDLLSHRGIAREAAPDGEAALVDPPVPGESDEVGEAVEGLPAAGDPRKASRDDVTIRIEDPDLCPRYLGLVIRGVTVGPSPPWLQTRLRAVGARPINNVVDSTNYVLLELGQPLHAFDLAKLAEATVVVRRATEGERIRTLDGVERVLSSDMLAICDARRPMAVAGVMGGEDSEVTAETRDILLECALFTPGPVRATRKALGLSTDASYRFERGVDPLGLERALRRCARLVCAVAGGRPDAAILDVGEPPPGPIRVTLRPGRIERVLGVAFSPDRIRALLEPLGFLVEGAGNGALQVEVPGHRSWDVTREVDLIEEVARTHGYGDFPDELGPYRPGGVPDHPLFWLEDALRDELTVWGLLEAQTPAFAPAGEGEVELLNPISSEERWLRSALLPALLRRVETNLARGNRDVRLFELGTVFRPGPAGELPVEALHLAAVLHGRRRPEHWSEADEPVDLWEVKGLLEALRGRLPGGQWRIVPAGGDEMDDGAPARRLDPAARFRVLDPEGREAGTGGRVLDGLLDLPPWAGAVWGLEISLPAIPEDPEPVAARPLPTHPGVERDLALLVPDARSAEEVVHLLHETGGALLREVSIFDVYQGAGIPEGTRSVAVRLRFRAEGRTLTDDEVDGQVASATRTLEEALGVRIRGE